MSGFVFVCVLRRNQRKLGALQCLLLQFGQILKQTKLLPPSAGLCCQGESGCECTHSGLCWVQNTTELRQALDWKMTQWVWLWQQPQKRRRGWCLDSGTTLSSAFSLLTLTTSIIKLPWLLEVTWHPRLMAALNIPHDTPTLSGFMKADVRVKKTLFPIRREGDKQG